jgi:hypothetical protein
MLGEPSPYDVLIFGYNAIAFSPTVRAALDAEPPRSPLVVLHQLRPDDYRFLTGRLQLTLRRAPGGHTEEAFVPYGRERDEILLNFPATPLQDASSLRARAINWFEFEPGSAWRIALEARVGARRLPVVVRTADTEPQRVVGLQPACCAPRTSGTRRCWRTSSLRRRRLARARGPGPRAGAARAGLRARGHHPQAAHPGCAGAACQGWAGPGPRPRGLAAARACGAWSCRRTGSTSC